MRGLHLLCLPAIYLAVSLLVLRAQQALWHAKYTYQKFQHMKLYARQTTPSMLVGPLVMGYTHNKKK